MFKRLRNQRGNIAIAMALAIVGVCSGVTMATLAFKEVIGARLNFDDVQELHFLRSEALRGQAVVELLDYSGDGFYLPSKYATVESSDAKTTYKLDTKIVKENVSTGGGLYFSSGYNVKTLAKANRGTSSMTMFGNNLSMVKKYGEKAIRRNSFAGFHYFTDTDESQNGTPVYFWGPDVIYGKVHSNSDIWLKQAGGGNNNNWPTFLGPVYTAGQIQSFSGTPPYESVFRAGYWEHVGELEFNATADLIRAHGTTVGPGNEDPNRIIYVDVAGTAYSSWIGQVINSGPDTADVWTQYPPRAGTYLFRNRYTKLDTVWTRGPSGAIAGTSAIMYSKAWLKGNFTGKQTWCATDTLWLNDNCTLTGTSLGQCPDGTETGSLINRQDFLGIVSEQSVLIQYGFRDPSDSTRYKPNCDGDGTNNGGGAIWIYAAICALGDGQGTTQRDGMFTFEYQHPHPSVPAVRLGTNNYVWDKIDIHRRKFPPTTYTGADRWPAGWDYPWYNPLWPEGRPLMERGTIHLWGSVAQRRRGYVHRNTVDGDYPNTNSIWNIPLDFCGGAAGVPQTDPVLGVQWAPANAVGATGSGVGYRTKDYHFDNRFSNVTPPDFPEVHVRGGLTPFAGEGWSFKKPPNTF